MSQGQDQPQSQHPTRKLGCVRSDDHKLRAAPWMEHYLVASALPPLPSYVDWSRKLTQPLGMMCNDRLGCCVVSAMGHGVQHYTAAQGAEVTPPDSEIEQTYLTATGGIDEGMQISDGMDIMLRTGLSGHKGMSKLLISPQNDRALRYAIYLFGGVYFGLSLTHESLQNQTGVWDIPESVRWRDRNFYRPDENDGHCVYCPSYRANGTFDIKSWAMNFNMTPRYKGACVNEAWVLLPADWNDGDGIAPNAIDWKTLVRDFPALAAA